MTIEIAQPIPAGEESVKYFTDAALALEWVQEIYHKNTSYIKERFVAYTKGEELGGPIHAGYPYVRVDVKNAKRGDSRLSYGFVAETGAYSTTLTRPNLFDHYYLFQFEQLLKNHGGELEIGVSEEAIPLHFALGEGFSIENDLSQEKVENLPDFFGLPNLMHIDDEIANGTYILYEGEDAPLALFTAPRVDVSLQRLKHYTATSAEHFQNFVLYTNYQFYVDEFVRFGQEMMSETDDPTLKEARSQYTAFVEPGEWITPNANLGGGKDPYGQRPPRLPQMPAYHLKRADGSGITLINIGVGPSNAKTITDHVAVLRPHAWIMLGHCAGLRNSQSLGDYVLAHGYVREDSVLDRDMPKFIPVPPLAEIQIALEESVAKITDLKGYELKRIMRTGTVATIDDRNWEFRDQSGPILRLSQSRAIALDMESATIAANGLRFRVPYGTLLCVSDKPLHGQLKLPGMADKFYRERVDQHLKIGIQTMEHLRTMKLDKLHSRKLRSFDEVAFQ